MSPPEHDRALASAFDGQSAQFERSPVQSDPDLLRRIVAFADLPPESQVLDVGCGPGLLAEAFLVAGHLVYGIDLSGEMVLRARRRCGERTSSSRRYWFRQGSLFDVGLTDPWPPFDATVSRYVLHHVTDPLAFLRRQVVLLRPNGVLILCDHTTDPDPALASWHQQIEKARDVTHTANLTPGALVDLLAASGLEVIRLVEEPFTLDFDEWFDRGTPSEPKEAVRDRLLSGPGARGFRVTQRPDGGLTIHCYRALLRAITPYP